MAKLRTSFTTKGLLSTTNKVLDSIKSDCKDTPVTKGKNKRITLSDCLKSGLAMFYLKYPSLLQFDNDSRNNKAVKNNLSKLFGINNVPSDTRMREQLDELSPTTLRPIFKKLFAEIQRGKVLEKYRYINNTYLISVDGTGLFSSKKVKCDNCCSKNHKNGDITYHHQMLNAVLIHPNISSPIPLAPEPIIMQDGVKKNDCELNAAKRLLTDIRREHPHLKITIVEDSLYSNVPHIRLLQQLDMNYILNIKPKSHKFLYNRLEFSNYKTYSYTDKKGFLHEFRYINNIQLNADNIGFTVNFIDYKETSPKGEVKKFGWITDHIITEDNINLLVISHPQSGWLDGC